MATVRSLITQLGFSVNDTQLKRYEKSTDNIRQRAETAANSFRNMFAALAVVQTVRQISSIADAMQSMQARIAALPQTQGDAADAFNTIADRATAARQSIDAYGSLYTRIGNAAKEYITTQEDLLKITDTVSKALVVGGASAGESASVMLQLSQALGSGVLQGQEFNAMAEGAPQLLDALSVAMGHPRDQLKKLASEGKITTKDLVLALQQVGPQFEESFKRMPLTIGQAFQMVTNRISKAVNRINQEAGVVDSITRGILFGFDKLGNGIERVINMLGGAQNAVKLLSIAIGAMLAVWLPGMVAAAAATLAASWPILAIIAAVTALGVVLEDVYQWFQGNDSVLGDLIGTSEEWSDEIENLKTLLGILGTAFSALWGTAKFFLQGVGQGFKLLGTIISAAFDSLRWAVDNIGKLSAFLGFGGEGNSAPTQIASNERRAAQIANQPWANGGAGTTNNTTINVTAAPGTPEANKEAARAGVKQAMDEGAGARKRGQAL